MRPRPPDPTMPLPQMMVGRQRINGQLRREKRNYIPLAAHLAAQPSKLDRVVMRLADIEDVLGEGLPPHSAFPFWWNNEGLSAHSRAWLSSGWEVASMDGDSKEVVFVRRHLSSD